MSKVTNNVLGTINVKSYKQCIRSNKCQKLQTMSKVTNNVLGTINVKSYKQYIRSNKCQKLQTMY